jgi:broad specificity phosphatase PhoE
LRAAGKLILVRHSAPQIVEGVPANLWKLSEAGRAAAGVLALRLSWCKPSAIWCSPEPKAQETASILSATLGAPIQEDERLREHERGSLGYIGRQELEAGVARLLTAGEHELVFGDETRRQVLDRMERAFQSAAAAAGGGSDLLMVTHGTALSILVSAHHSIDPVSFWRGLAVPAAVVIGGDRLYQVS